MTDMLEVHTSTGALRKDFTEAEIEALSPERRECFTALLSASLECEAAETEMVDAIADEASCKQAQDAAEEAHRKAHPPADRITELRKVIAAQQLARAR
jgi:hypothetical protein